GLSSGPLERVEYSRVSSGPLERATDTLSLPNHPQGGTPLELGLSSGPLERVEYSRVSSGPLERATDTLSLPKDPQGGTYDSLLTLRILSLHKLLKERKREGVITHYSP